MRAAEASSEGSGSRVLVDACHTVAAATGTQTARVWRWAFVERVTTGLYLGWLGHPDQAATFLDSATLVAGQQEESGAPTADGAVRPPGE